MIIDYQNITATITGNDIVLTREGETVMRFIRTPELEETSALLRVNGEVAMYRAVTVTSKMIEDVSVMLRTVMKTLPDGMFYAYGRLLVRNRKNSHKTNCRTLMIGAIQVAQRNGRLVLLPFRVPGVGVVDVEGTGQTDQLYVQLNSLL